MNQARELEDEALPPEALQLYKQAMLGKSYGRTAAALELLEHANTLAYNAMEEAEEEGVDAMRVERAMNHYDTVAADLRELILEKSESGIEVGLGVRHGGRLGHDPANISCA